MAVRGEVVLNDQITPRADAKLVFMNADKPEQKEYVNANAYGEFDVHLPAGTWYLYVGGESATRPTTSRSPSATATPSTTRW